MKSIHHELSVLAKAVHFKNLSAAAVHVGLSQPQLSRIIAKIEDELQIVILDRGAKRKSGWTPVAFELVEIYEKSIRRLESDLNQMTQKQIITEVRIGTLEGLSSLALKIAKTCFSVLETKKVVVDIFDISDLEAHFISGNLDLILSSKAPGRQRHKHFVEVGYQDLKKINSHDSFGVYSTFEYNAASKKEIEAFPHIFVSNSLSLRKEWFKNPGGSGFIPTEPQKGKSSGHEPVLLIGSDLMSPVVWQEIAKLFKS